MAFILHLNKPISICSTLLIMYLLCSLTLSYKTGGCDMTKRNEILNAEEYVARIREQRANSINRYRARKREQMLTRSNLVQNSEKTYIDDGDCTIYLKNASKYSQITILSRIAHTAVVEWIKTFDFTQKKKSVKITYRDSGPIILENVPIVDIDEFCTVLVIHLRRMSAKVKAGR